jgi:hypothetical protein
MTLLPARTKLMLLTALVCLFAARTAAAQTNPATCVNDDDCIATPACGGEICDWSTINHTCKPAGTGPKGTDGWCTVDADCKCLAEGATCLNLYCTFTRPCDAPGAAGCATGGTSGGGGSGAGGSGAAGTSGGGGGGGCLIAATAPIETSVLLVALGLFVLSRRRKR